MSWLVVVGCGRTPAPIDGAVDAVTPHLALPAIPDHGGPRLAHGKLVTITIRCVMGSSSFGIGADHCRRHRFD